ncbi:hypothetical protein HGRIS_001162 [Hohenbuehelia grisea]|uniref:Uncharacterized protein n=1 Tax=Hohenbuehelia grisea TaxID=104357 RepID=A0ABR3JPQ6_9AGAR
MDALRQENLSCASSHRDWITMTMPSSWFNVYEIREEYALVWCWVIAARLLSQCSPSLDLALNQSLTSLYIPGARVVLHKMIIVRPLAAVGDRTRRSNGSDQRIGSLIKIDRRSSVGGVGGHLRPRFSLTFQPPGF